MNFRKWLHFIKPSTNVVESLQHKVGVLEDKVVELQLWSTDYYRNRRNAIFNLADYMVNAELSGDYAEFGVFQGGTFAHACKTLGPLFPDMRFFAFDSFQGLPDANGIDANNGFSSGFHRGQFACSEEQFLENLELQGVDISRVVCIKGWFDESLTEEMADHYGLSSIRIAWVDCDYYASTVPVLSFLASRLFTGACLVFDDWHCYRNLPTYGEQRACSEWLECEPKVKLHELFNFGFHGKVFTVENQNSLSIVKEIAVSGISCPVCNSNQLQHFEQFFLDPIFDRWQSEINVQFPSDLREEYSQKPLRRYVCASCSHEFFCPACQGSADFYDIITSNESYYIEDKWEFKLARKWIDNCNCDSVVDYGCGKGLFLKSISNESIYRIGCDIRSLDKVELQSHGINYYLLPDQIAELVSQCRKEEISSYAVSMLQVLEHIDHPHDLFDSLEDVLNNCRLLIISVPNRNGPVSYFQNSLTEIPPHHVARWSYESLSTFLMLRNFRIIEAIEEPLPLYLSNMYLPKMTKEENYLFYNRYPEQKTTSARLLALAQDLDRMRDAGLTVIHGIPGPELVVFAEPCIGGEKLTAFPPLHRQQEHPVRKACELAMREIENPEALRTELHRLLLEEQNRW